MSHDGRIVQDRSLQSMYLFIYLSTYIELFYYCSHTYVIFVLIINSTNFHSISFIALFLSFFFSIKISILNVE